MKRSVSKEGKDTQIQRPETQMYFKLGMFAHSDVMCVVLRICESKGE